MKRTRRLIREIGELAQTVTFEILKMEKILENAPEGNLQVNNFSGKRNCQYVWRTIVDGVRSHMYLSKKDNWGKIQELGNVRYARRAIKNLTKLRRGCDAFLKNATTEVGEELANIFAKKNIPISNEVALSLDEDIERWYKKRNHKAPKMKNYTEPKIETLRGEKVRSKAEAIIANILYSMNIPYKYEEPFKLANGRWVYPDFTIYNTITKEECIIEHFGILDDNDYADTVCVKVEKYQASGLILGRTLLFTMETKRRPLSPANVQRMIENMFNLCV